MCVYMYFEQNEEKAKRSGRKRVSERPNQTRDEVKELTLQQSNARILRCSYVKVEILSSGSHTENATTSAVNVHAQVFPNALNHVIKYMCIWMFNPDYDFNFTACTINNVLCFLLIVYFSVTLFLLSSPAREASEGL